MQLEVGKRVVARERIVAALGHTVIERGTDGEVIAVDESGVAGVARFAGVIEDVRIAADQVREANPLKVGDVVFIGHVDRTDVVVDKRIVRRLFGSDQVVIEGTDARNRSRIPTSECFPTEAASLEDCIRKLRNEHAFLQSATEQALNKLIRTERALHALLDGQPS